MGTHGHFGKDGNKAGSSLGGQQWLLAPAPPRLLAGGSGISQCTTSVPVSFPPGERSPRQMLPCAPAFDPWSARRPATHTQGRRDGHSAARICSQSSRWDRSSQDGTAVFPRIRWGPHVCWARPDPSLAWSTLREQSTSSGSPRPQCCQWKKHGCFIDPSDRLF